MRKWGRIIKPGDENDIIILETNEQEVINPLCKLCAERVDSSMTTRTDVICMYGLEPELSEKDGMAGTKFRCRMFNPIDDLVLKNDKS